MFQVMAGLSEQLAAFRHISLFHYVNASDIIAHKALDGVYTGIMILIMLAAVSGAFVWYRRKDIAG